MNITLVLGYLAKGGTERQVAYLSSGLAQRGHSVRILLLGHRLEDEYPIAADVQVVPLQITKLRHCLSGWRTLRAAFRTSDVVYSFLDVANALCALAKPQGGAPLVWGLRAANTNAGWLAQLGLWMSRRLVARAECLVANSLAVRAYYQAQGIGGERTKVIANGVQTLATVVPGLDEVGNTPGIKSVAGSNRQGLRSRLELPKDSFVALILARAASEKRQELGLKLLEQNPDLFLIFAGDGVSTLPRQWQNQGLVTTNLLERCRFLEHQTDVGLLLSGVDVLLSLSSAEGFPNSILEAMAYEVPVVATAVGGVVELLAGTDAKTSEYGWPVPVDTEHVGVELEVAALGRAIAAVRAGGPDVQRRTHNARRRVNDHFGIKRMLDRSEGLLELLANPVLP